MHVRLISMTMTLVEAYNVLLLIQVLAAMLLICILSYDLLVNTAEEEQSLFSDNFFNFLSYFSGIVLLIFTYCYVAESLVDESTRVHRAFSECGWENMPTGSAKSIIICMARSSQPHELTAGNFYKFSLSGFTDIMKTSMAYLSVSRNLL